MRNSSKMGDALQNWLYLFFGSKDEVAVVNDKVKCPSGGTISRARPKVDVGLMLMRRKFWKENWQNTSIQLGYLTTTFDSNPNSNSTQPTNLLISTPPLQQLQSTPINSQPGYDATTMAKELMVAEEHTIQLGPPNKTFSESESVSDWCCFQFKVQFFHGPQDPDPGPRCLCCC